MLFGFTGVVEDFCSWLVVFFGIGEEVDDDIGVVSSSSGMVSDEDTIGVEVDDDIDDDIVATRSSLGMASDDVTIDVFVDDAVVDDVVTLTSFVPSSSISSGISSTNLQ